MVEGPGCTLNGEKIRSRVKQGQKVLRIRGNAGDLFQCFEGSQYSGVQTLGKELFMYFGERALRLHFGMEGSMRINAAERKGGRGNPPSLIIFLTEDSLMFYSTTTEIRLSEDCRERVRLMACLDVCSPSFSVCAALTAVCKQRAHRVCDVLLDQSVLPGVGNIIKNEALFLTALHPAVRVNQLNPDLVRCLVKMTRDFTLLFYQCRKRGSALQKHCKVYKRSCCAQCGRDVTVCRLGGDNRMTYFCSRCQTEDPTEIDISKLPGPKAFLSWTSQKPKQDVEHEDEEEEEEEWSCDLCSLINRAGLKFCEACMSPRAQARTDAVEAPPIFGALIRLPHNTFSKPQQEVTLQRRAAFGGDALVPSDLGSGPRSGTDSNSAGIRTQPTGPHGAKRTSPGFPSVPSKRRRTEREEPRRPAGGVRTDKNQNTSSSGTASLPTIPCCTTHRRPAVVRAVMKDGENKGRHFYTCSLPRGAQCQYFEWADLHFPTCHHSKRTLMRRVLKLGPSNGRRFYVCPLKRGKQCEFFQWAEQSS